MHKQFYVFDPETGFEECATEAEAREAAESSIESYRDNSGDGWSEDVENVHYGSFVVLGYAQQCDVNYDVPKNRDYDFTCDYRLAAPSEPGESASDPARESTAIRMAETNRVLRLLDAAGVYNEDLRERIRNGEDG